MASENKCAPTTMIMVGQQDAGKRTIATTILQRTSVDTHEPIVKCALNRYGETVTHWHTKESEGISVLMYSCPEPWENLTWLYVCECANILIYVIDSSQQDYSVDKNRLHGLLGQKELCHVPILLYANKQDKPGALKTLDVAGKLGLSGHSRIEIVECIARFHRDYTMFMGKIASIMKPSQRAIETETIIRSAVAKVAPSRSSGEKATKDEKTSLFSQLSTEDDDDE